MIHSKAGSLRILQVLEPSGGGSGRHFLDLCKGLARRGHHVHAIYSPVRAEAAFVKELTSCGLAAVSAVAMDRAPGRSDVAAFRAINRIRATSGPFDIIHGHSSKAGALTRLRLPGKHVPRVYTPHAFRTMDPTLGMAGRLIYGGIELLLARFFTDRLICVSKDEYAHAVAMGMPPERLGIVINGVASPPVRQRTAVRQQFGIPQDALVFGFVGRLSQQKAPERLVEAFRQASSHLPGAHLLMIGSGELEPALRTQIAGSGLQSRIHLTASIAGPIAMQAFDLLVMPSRYEAMSYVMLEAAAAGKPIVTTAIGGASMAVEDGVSGIIVPNSDDVGGLANALRVFDDPDLRQRFETAAAKRKNGFRLGTMIEETERLYFALARSAQPVEKQYPASIERDGAIPTIVSADQ